MTEKTLKCISCGRDIMNQIGSVTFKCPQCNEVVIVRCNSCRELATKYECPKCGFKGPN